MVDKFTVEKRSEIMSKIRGKDTNIEMLVRRYLYARGYRYRKNYKELPGTPDIALTRYKIAIFINGCFWHGHDNCKLYVVPKSRTEFWTRKVEMNRARDSRNQEELTAMGWQVIILWECELGRNFDTTMINLQEKIKQSIISE